MTKLHTCDICGKAAKIVAKLFLSDLARTNKKSAHASYSHHLDIGDCCYAKVLKNFKWQTRMTRAEYMASRRAGK